MNIKIENIGKIKKGEIKTNQLLILCGPNNFGKTYLAYSIYGIYKSIKNVYKLEKVDIDKILNGEVELRIGLGKIREQILKNSKIVSKNFKNDLPNFFNYEKKFFADTNFEIILEENDIKFSKNKLEVKLSLESIAPSITFEIVEKEMIIIINYGVIQRTLTDHIIYAIENIINSSIAIDSFILPSVREGLNMFRSELNVSRNVLIDTLMSHQNKKINPYKIMNDVVSKYPLPISEYIEFINNLENKKKNKGKYGNLANEIGKIVDGSYSYENGQIFFKPYKSNDIKIPFHMASATVRCLAGLYFYLKHEVNPRVLIIDEPELNLHPNNQRKMARFLAKAINNGLEVIITTHSSYILQELNNLILFNNDFKNKEKLLKKFKYTKEEILDPQKVSSYLLDKGEVKKMEIEEQGIIMDTFNSVIDSMNDLNNTLLFEIEEEC